MLCIASEKPKGKWAILRFCMDFLGRCKHLDWGLLGPDRPVLIFDSFGGNPWWWNKIGWHYKTVFLKDGYIENRDVKAKCNSSTRSQINLLPIPLFVQLLFPLQPIQHLPFTEATAIWTIKQQLWATTDFLSGDDIHQYESQHLTISNKSFARPFYAMLNCGPIYQNTLSLLRPNWVHISSTESFITAENIQGRKISAQLSLNRTVQIGGK